MSFEGTGACRYILLWYLGSNIGHKSIDYKSLLKSLILNWVLTKTKKIGFVDVSHFCYFFQTGEFDKEHCDIDKLSCLVLDTYIINKWLMFWKMAKAVATKQNGKGILGITQLTFTCSKTKIETL